MAHGYMRDFDEGRGDERERWRDADRERGWRDEGRDRGSWRGNEPDSSDRNRSFMLGRRDRSDWERAPRNFSSHQDDHYRSWRDKQMQALDRDYEDYCREREQQFHSDFDAWRNQRRGNNREPLRAGVTQTGPSQDPSGSTQLINEARDNAEPRADPMDAATVGTNSSG